MMPPVSIIIPTLASRARGGSLFRAIKSVSADGPNCPCVPIIVVNGTRYDPGILDELKTMPGIRFFYREEPGSPKAARFGREQVNTPFFCFLDDDDEYLPGAIEARLRPFMADHSVDVVVSNGYKYFPGEKKKTLKLTDLEAIRNDPMEALFNDQLWLPSCAGLFRSDSIGEDFFDPEIKFLEWTYLAFKLSLSRRLAFVSEPTYLINDTPNSVSENDDYFKEIPLVLNRMLDFDAPRSIKRKIMSKRNASYHDLAALYRRRGERSVTWKYHLQSFGNLDGFLKYALSTRWLIRDLMFSQTRSNEPNE